jgi:hypothetical protein
MPQRIELMIGFMPKVPAADEPVFGMPIFRVTNAIRLATPESPTRQEAQCSCGAAIITTPVLLNHDGQTYVLPSCAAHFLAFHRVEAVESYPGGYLLKTIMKFPEPGQPTAAELAGVSHHWQ